VDRLAYRPIGIVLGALGGMIAGGLFQRLWTAISGEEDAPEPTRRSATWRYVLLAGALQGAVFGLVKAAVDRGGAKAFQRLTGSWPGEE
jgi:MFS family permease